MASKKTYIVKKDDEIVEELKTLTAAKRLADAEGAEVFCDDQCVYTGVKEDKVVEAEKDESVTFEEDPKEDEIIIVHAEPVVAETPKQPKVEEQVLDRYRLLSFMNVRSAPSLGAPKVSTKPEGTVVRVLGVENDWLHLPDDTYILFDGGRFAEKM